MGKLDSLRELKTLMIDLDDTISFGGFLYEINRYLGTDYKVEDFKDYYMQNIIPKDLRKEFFEQLKFRNIYEGSILLPYAKETIEALNEKYEIHIVSSFMIPELGASSAIFIPQKMEFLMENLPFLDPKRFSFTSQKTYMNFDNGIDDLYQNLAGVKRKLLMKTYHNKNISSEILNAHNIEMAEDWPDIGKKLL